MLILMFWYPYRVRIDRRASRITFIEYDLDITKIKLRKLKVLMAAIVYGLYNMIELCYFFFSPTLFQLLPVRMTIGEASRAYSLMTSGFTAGKLLTGILLLKLKSNKVIFFHHGLIILSTVSLYLFQENKTSIYLQSIMMGMASRSFQFLTLLFLGYGLSAMQPGILQYTEEKLKLTFQVSTLFAMVMGFAAAVSPMVLGIYFKSNPEIIFIFNFVAILTCLTLYTTVEILTCFDVREPIGSLSAIN